MTISIYIDGDLDQTLTTTMSSRDRWDVGYVSFTEDAEGDMMGVFVEDDSEPYRHIGSCDEDC